MEVIRSPEIEAVAQRVSHAYNGQFEALRNLMSSGEELRVLGFDQNEWWQGIEEFMSVREAQQFEVPDIHVQVVDVEGFQVGNVGWATVFTILTTPEGESHFRSTGVFGLEAGVWRVLNWHNSIPVGNEQVFGITLPVTLNDLVDSVLEDAAPLLSDSDTGGIATLVFTDIVESTRHAETLGDERWSRMIADHEEAIRSATEELGGRVVKFLGDGSMLAFETTKTAIHAAVDIQQTTVDQPFQVRIGIHTGEVLHTESDLFGLTVNKAARVAAAASPDEIVMSATTRDLAGSLNQIEFGQPRLVTLKGLTGAHQIFPLHRAAANGDALDP